MSRVLQHLVPGIYALCGLGLLITAAWTGSGSALAAVALLAALLIAAAADPPVAARQPRRRAAGRLVAAGVALVLGTIGVIASLAGGFELNDDWAVIAIVAGSAAALMALSVLGLGRGEADAPLVRSERTALLRGSAVALTLAVGILIAAYVLPAVDTVAGIALGLLAVLEGVALARPGGAGLRRMPTPEEARAVESAIMLGPGEVAGHRRLVIRSTGGAEYLSLEVLLSGSVAPARSVAVRDGLEHAIKLALPDLVVDVRVVQDPQAAPEPVADAAQKRSRPSQAPDDQVTQAWEPPAESVDSTVLGSAPWLED